MLETILLTGFGPYGPHSRNGSEEAIARLDGLSCEGFSFRALALPVQFERATEALREALETERPAAVIACGIHGDADGSGLVRVELVARNERDYPRPDVDGVTVEGEAVEEGGPPTVFSSLPVGSIKLALDEAGIKSELSEDAGRFLCNAVFYWLGRRVTPSGFIHVPPQVERIDDVTRAVRTAAEVTARRLAAQRVEATA